LARLARSLAEVQAELLPAESPPAFRELAETAIASSADIQEFQDAVFADIALFNEKSAPSQEARLASAVAEVKRIIDGDLGGDLSLSRLGNSVGLSPGYLGKAFAAVAGTHLVDYVTERRLAEAARLLRESGDDVQAIGRLVGFNSPAYFIRRFKERFGRTPYDYRRAASGRRKPNSAIGSKKYCLKSRTFILLPKVFIARIPFPGRFWTRNPIVERNGMTTAQRTIRRYVSNRYLFCCWRRESCTFSSSNTCRSTAW
jgi:AraC-like DNA-binding protein